MTFASSEPSGPHEVRTSAARAPRAATLLHRRAP